MLRIQFQTYSYNGWSNRLCHATGIWKIICALFRRSRHNFCHIIGFLSLGKEIRILGVQLATRTNLAINLEVRWWRNESDPKARFERLRKIRETNKKYYLRQASYCCFPLNPWPYQTKDQNSVCKVCPVGKARTALQ